MVFCTLCQQGMIPEAKAAKDSTLKRYAFDGGAIRELVQWEKRSARKRIECWFCGSNIQPGKTFYDVTWVRL